MSNLDLEEYFMNGLQGRNRSGIPFGRTDSGPLRGPVPGSGTPTNYPNPLPPAYTGGGPPWSPPAYPPKPNVIIPPPGTMPPSFPGKRGPPTPGVPPSPRPPAQRPPSPRPPAPRPPAPRPPSPRPPAPRPPAPRPDDSGPPAPRHPERPRSPNGRHPGPNLGPAPRGHLGRGNINQRIRLRNRTIWPYIPFGYQGWFGPYDYYNNPSTVYNQTYNYYGYPENINDNTEEELNDQNMINNYSDIENQLFVTNPDFVQQLR